MRFFFFFIFCIPFATYSQQQYYTLDYPTTTKILLLTSGSDSIIHTGFRPYLSSDINRYVNADEFLCSANRDSAVIHSWKHPWFWKKLRTEDLIQIKDTGLTLLTNPMFRFEFGKNMADDSSLHINTRGIWLRGNLNEKVSFSSEFYENQGYFPAYVHEYIDARHVVPGQGRVRLFKKTGFDYSNVAGYVSYTPTPSFNLQLGHGKNFIGEGYRSLLLSDFSYNYPYIKFTSSFGRFRYINMLTAFQNVTTSDNDKVVFDRSHGSFCWLSWAPVRWFQASLFEAIIWKTSDTSYSNRFPAQYFNPIIGIRPAIYGLNDQNNAVLGFTSSIRVTKGFILYNQLVIDAIDFSNFLKGKEYNGNRTGWQVGFRFAQPFKIKNLILQGEINSVRPYTYSHELPRQNFSNFNEPLAHPLGANFREALGIIHYQVHDFNLEIKYCYAEQGTDYAGTNFGADIFKSDTSAYYGINTYNNGILQGRENKISNLTVQLGFIINPKTNLQLFTGFHGRVLKNNFGTTISNYFYFGIKTSIANLYYDF